MAAPAQDDPKPPAKRQRRSQGARTVERTVTRRTLDGTRNTSRAAKELAKTQRVVDIRKKQERALDLRLSGATLQQIADQLGYGGPPSAKKAIDTAIQRIGYEPAEELVHLELRRLDKMQSIAWLQLVQGDTYQISNILRIMEMRAKYAGVDAFLHKEISQQINVQVGTDGKVSIANAQGVMVISGDTEDEYVTKLAAAMGITPDEFRAMMPTDEEDPQVIDAELVDGEQVVYEQKEIEAAAQDAEADNPFRVKE
jgi:hypothetical protein